MVYEMFCTSCIKDVFLMTKSQHNYVNDMQQNLMCCTYMFHTDRLHNEATGFVSGCLIVLLVIQPDMRWAAQ